MSKFVIEPNKIASYPDFDDSLESDEEEEYEEA